MDGALSLFGELQKPRTSLDLLAMKLRQVNREPLPLLPAVTSVCPRTALVGCAGLRDNFLTSNAYVGAGSNKEGHKSAIRMRKTGLHAASGTQMALARIDESCIAWCMGIYITFFSLLLMHNRLKKRARRHEMACHLQFPRTCFISFSQLHPQQPHAAGIGEGRQVQKQTIKRKDVPKCTNASQPPEPCRETDSEKVRSRIACPTFTLLWAGRAFTRRKLHVRN